MWTGANFNTGQLLMRGGAVVSGVEYGQWPDVAGGCL